MKKENFNAIIEKAIANEELKHKEKVEYLYSNTAFV
ncbi:MAG: hypothetical protein FD159_204 [Syntrophaceae bacterium]|nr:MAG: hypothetical protein FD159_204 [Syntrophaceae bacterium]